MLMFSNLQKFLLTHFEKAHTREKGFYSTKILMLKADINY